jgi:hypothetical protein
MKLNHHLRLMRMPCLIGILVVLLASSSCQKQLYFDGEGQEDHNIILHFQPVVQYDSNKLKFGDTYKNFFNENFTVKTFKFYIHDIELINTDSGRTFRVGGEQTFLVDGADSLSSLVKFAILPYKYNRISFTIGVDSARNVSGAQTGALDPAKGMFWTWSSGYIMAKLEGTSPSSSAAGNMFEYHIGGFQGADNVLKKVTLLFPFAQDIDLKPGKSTQMTIAADVYDWFYNPHDIRFSVNPVVTTPGLLATQIAENYSKMFTVTKINNE